LSKRYDENVPDDVNDEVKPQHVKCFITGDSNIVDTKLRSMSLNIPVIPHNLNYKSPINLSDSCSNPPQLEVRQKVSQPPLEEDKYEIISENEPNSR
jgi:hypothetical protein